MPITNTINYRDAATYISDFLSNSQFLYLRGTRIALGGTLYAENLRPPRLLSMTGLTGWYCDNSEANLPDFPQLFVAFERDGSAMPSSSSTPRSAQLVAPAESFVYADNGGNTPRYNDQGAVIDFLRDQMLIPQQQDLSITSGQVKGLAETFRNNIPRGYDIDSRSFFETDDHEFEAMVSQPGVVYVRYFFGYLKGSFTDFRLILAPVNANGENILYLPDGNEAIWLERTWPY